MIIEKISKDFGLSKEFVRSTISSASHSYKIYYISKKGGGDRKIEHPSKKLKVIQRWLAKSVFECLPLHEAARAYRKGTNIADNARVHCGQRFLLKLDFLHFFGSIKSQDIHNLLSDNQGRLPSYITPDEYSLVCRAVCRNGALVIGAPSSPVISNAIMFEFDKLVSKRCGELNVNYSRYADDLTFSTNNRDVLEELHSDVRAIVRSLRYPRLHFNNAKSHHSSKKRRMKVTGLVLTNQGGVSVGRQQKRFIRGLIHQVETGKCVDDDAEYLVGYLNFLRAVEPEFLDRLNRKYGNELISKILLHGTVE